MYSRYFEISLEGMRVNDVFFLVTLSGLKKDCGKYFPSLIKVDIYVMS